MSIANFDENAPSGLEGQLDPLAAPAESEFDWDTLYQRLGEGTTPLEDRDYDAMVAVLRALLEWVLSTRLDLPCSDRIVGRRAIALAWTINPAMFQGVSLTRIANILGCDPSKLHRPAGDVVRTFGITNPGQRVSDHNRKGVK